MTVNAWTNDNYPLLKKAIDRITKHSPLSEELLHYTLEVLLLRKDLFHLVQTGEAWYMCLKIATNNWNSVNSPFHRTYRQDHQDISTVVEKPDTDSDYDDKIDTLLGKIDTELKKITWYEEMLFKVYVELNENAALLSRKTGIPRTSINLTIKRVRQHLKTQITHE